MPLCKFPVLGVSGEVLISRVVSVEVPLLGGKLVLNVGPQIARMVPQWKFRPWIPWQAQANAACLHSGALAPRCKLKCLIRGAKEETVHAKRHHGYM